MIDCTKKISSLMKDLWEEFQVVWAISRPHVWLPNPLLYPFLSSYYYPVPFFSFKLFERLVFIDL